MRLASLLLLCALGRGELSDPSASASVQFSASVQSMGTRVPVAARLPREAVTGGAQAFLARRLFLRGGGDAGCGERQHDISQQNPQDLMQKMVGAMVAVSLKVGPRLCGRLASIDAQMNMVLEKPVEQWVNGTLASVDDADVFVRCHNVIDFGVLQGTTDHATVKILEQIGIRSPSKRDDAGSVTGGTS